MARGRTDLDHLFVRLPPSRRPYTYRGGGGGTKPKYPQRADGAAHARRLLREIAATQAAAARVDRERAAKGINAQNGTFIDVRVVANRAMKMESLEDRRAGIEIANVAAVDATYVKVTLFVPTGKIAALERKLKAFLETASATKPKNAPLVTSIEQFRVAAAQSFWTDPVHAFPSVTDPVPWEVWIRDSVDESQFVEDAARCGCWLSERRLKFPDRIVRYARATVEAISASTVLLDAIVELRRPPALDLEFLNLEASFERDLGADFSSRLRVPRGGAFACVLDTGVDVGHPLIGPALADEDAHTCFGSDRRDASPHVPWHGTGTAGLALHGDQVAERSLAKGTIDLTHRLESVKIVPSTGANDTAEYGPITREAIDRVEITDPARSRVFALTVTAEEAPKAEPTAWSATLDALACGSETTSARPRLFLVSAGNTSPGSPAFHYPSSNHVSVIEDPAHAWNAITVGAFTSRVHIAEPEYRGWRAMSSADDLSPASRTSLPWIDTESAPIKPEIVCEGGNWATEPGGKGASALDSLQLLTARKRDALGSRIFGRFNGTSAAAALASGMAAQIRSRYPTAWPETVRALLVHSARWTPPMHAQFPDDKPRRRAEKLIRCFGYGVPDLSRALASANDRLTLVVEQEIQPFESDEDGKVGPRTMHLHELPWPSEVLDALGEAQAFLRVTLSYFIEPNPGKRGVAGEFRMPVVDRARYASHALRFDVKTGSETLQQFQVRLSKAIEGKPTPGDMNRWSIGDVRHRGSIHSDVWEGHASELAGKSAVIVYPASGWWRFRKDRAVSTRRARYSLVVSIETPGSETDIYTPVEQAIAVTLPAP